MEASQPEPTVGGDAGRYELRPAPAVPQSS